MADNPLLTPADGSVRAGATPVGRFAPSPTGALHLGSLVAAIGSHLYAKSLGGRWLLRIEDLDTPRNVPGADAAILRDLERLGLEWDGSVLYQSSRLEAYAAALETLRAQGAAFACGCSRREVSLGGRVYPGTCRTGLPPGRTARAVRMQAPEGEIRFLDLLRGPQLQHPARQGDFVIHRADGIFAYVFACVLDDAAQGVTQIVRGADLLEITGRQRLLQEALGYPEPIYAHLPLVLDASGHKLSKRTGAKAWGDHPSDAWARALAHLGWPLPAELQGAPVAEIRRYGLECAGKMLRARLEQRPGPVQAQ